MLVGLLFIAFTTITAFDVRYLFTCTLPFIAAGVCLMIYGWYVFNKEVDEKGKSQQTMRLCQSKTDIDIENGAQIKKHHVHVGENRKERRLRDKRVRKEMG